MPPGAGRSRRRRRRVAPVAASPLWEGRERGRERNGGKAERGREMRGRSGGRREGRGRRWCCAGCCCCRQGAPREPPPSPPRAAPSRSGFRICVVSLSRRLFASRIGLNAKYVIGLSHPLERVFGTQNTVNYLCCVWVTSLETV